MRWRRSSLSKLDVHYYFSYPETFVEHKGDIVKWKELVNVQLRGFRKMLQEDADSAEVPVFWYSGSPLVDHAAFCLDSSFRPEVAKLFKQLQWIDTPDCERATASASSWGILRGRSATSRDGKHRTRTPEMLAATLCAQLSLATKSGTNLDQTWLDGLPDTSDELHDCHSTCHRHTNTRCVNCF